jgi:hypothetical protein
LSPLSTVYILKHLCLATGIRFFAERRRLCQPFFSIAQQKRLCREPNKKTLVKASALGKDGFIKCQIKNTRSLLSAKKTLGKDFFAECQSKTLGKAIFQTMFWCPKRIQIKKFSNYKVL